jgi:hypothetical protein
MLICPLRCTASSRRLPDRTACPVHTGCRADSPPSRAQARRPTLRSMEPPQLTASTTIMGTKPWPTSSSTSCVAD